MKKSFENGLNRSLFPQNTEKKCFLLCAGEKENPRIGKTAADFSLAKMGVISYTFIVLRPIKKILIIKLRAIGDVVLATPVIENLRAAFPEATIDFLTESPSVPIVETNPYLTRVVEYPRQKWEKFSGRRRLILDLGFLRHLRRQKYTLVLDLFGNPRSAFMTWVTRAPLRVGFDFRGRKFAYNLVAHNRGAEVHEVEFNLDALRKVGVPIQAKRPKIWLHEADRNYVEKWWRRTGIQENWVVGFNPSGSWPAKRWPHKYWVRLGRELVRKWGASVVVFWGPGEKLAAEHVVREIGTGALLAPFTTLRQLAALCERLTLVVSNDAGPMHISATTGTPTIGLFGPTNAHLQGPFGEENRAVKNPKIPCLGCNRLTCPILDCMTYLTPEMVLSELRDLLPKTKGASLQAEKWGSRVNS